MDRKESDLLLTQLYEGNGLFAKIIDTPAEEAFSSGFTIKGEISRDGIEYATEYLDWLHWEETAMTAVKWARLYGGSAIVMLINDGGGIDEPLNRNIIRSVDGLQDYDRSIIRPDYAGYEDHCHQIPERYRIFSKHGTFAAHSSRCLVFRNGSALHERSTESHLWPWAIPEAYRILEALQNAEVSHGNALRLLERSIQPIHKVRGLSQKLSTPEGEAQALRQVETVDLARRLFDTIAVDLENDFYFRSAMPEGIRKTVDVSDRMLSAVTGIPEIVLWGKPVDYERPGQMWRTQARSTLEQWYSFIGSIQTGMVKGNLWQLLSIIFHAGVHSGKLPMLPHFDIEFSPLWAVDDLELADIEFRKADQQLAKAKTAEMYVKMGILQPTEIRKGLFKKNRKRR